MKSGEKTLLVRGFTIVELLIVIVVIAVLAAIVVVSYNGITKRANVSALKADLSQFGKSQEAYRTVNGSAFGNTAQMQTAGAAGLAQKSTWTTPNSSLAWPGKTTTTPKGKYLLSYRSSIVNNIWINGVQYRDIKNEEFEVAYWNFDTGQWEVKLITWYGDVQKYEYNDVYSGYFSNQDGSFPCTEATFEQCQDNPT